METPRVHVISLGGTIAMTSADDGRISPGLSGEDLIGALPSEFTAETLITCETFSTRPGAHLEIDDGIELARRIEKVAYEGDIGFVVTQGTDTLEEMAFLVDVLHGGAAPVVFTGAMRAPSALGSDAVLNLANAICLARDARARDLGVLVALNDQVHAARFVRKMHTSNPGAFQSPTVGPVGWFTEGRVRLPFAPRRGAGLPVDRVSGSAASVALYQLTLGDDGQVLRALRDLDLDGVVLEAFGVGHVSDRILSDVVALSATLPVVLASRVGIGEVHTSTYDFPGAEIGLLELGLIWGGALDGPKARLLLALGRRAGHDRDGVAGLFRSWDS